jgi:hypothetical protein
MQSLQQNQGGIEQTEGEISLLDIVNFLIDSWKKLAIAAVAGAILGFAGWNFLGSYQAEYVLLNNNNNNNSYALDLVSWKTIQKSLPNLAAQIEDEGRAPEGQARFYKTLASEQWWQKNVAPSYAISKADIKDLAAISKDLDLASTTILSLTVKADGPTKEKAIENVRTAAAFLRTGSAYLQLRSILNSYETETISTVADLQKKITTTEIEMGYQMQRAKSLEDLHKRFPGGNNNNNQVVDPKDSGAKYLPLATQIIAINNDINQSKESLMRLRDRLTQIAQMKLFLEEASPLAEKTFDGILLGDSLLAIEAKLRAKLPKEDIKQQEAFDQLRTQLLSVKSRFTKSLNSNTAPISSKKGMIKTTARSLAGAFFLMLLVLLGQRVWVSIKENAKSSGAKR